MITFSHTKKRLETKGRNITAFQKVQGDQKSCLGSENEGSRPGMIVEVNDLFSDEIFTTTIQARNCNSGDTWHIHFAK